MRNSKTSIAVETIPPIITLACLLTLALCPGLILYAVLAHAQPVSSTSDNSNIMPSNCSTSTGNSISSNLTSACSPNGTDWQSYGGHLVPKGYTPVFVVLACLVNMMGSWATLELLERRTSLKGIYNWSLMVSAALSMGGMGIWCMHFIGNRAVVLGQGQIELQILYNPGFTALSFFFPVILMIMAFSVAGPGHHLTLDRLILGGLLVAFGIVGMHFLGQAGISNYDCFYDLPYVFGALVVGSVLSVVALACFSTLAPQWKTGWLKMAFFAFIWSCAASGMHWLVSIGTLYRLRTGSTASTSTAARNATTVLALMLSIVGCFCLLLLTLSTQARLKRASKRAQQVVLATAIFDSEGRLLTTLDGTFPSRKITNSYLEQGMNDFFNVYHPAYLWMYRTSRNWNSIVDLVPLMKRHLIKSGMKLRFGEESDYKNDQGTIIENYALIFRELFCAAAADLADDLSEPLENLGVLYDEIVATDQRPKPNRFKPYERVPMDFDLEAEGVELEKAGKGQILFLVRNVNRKVGDRLEALGYRFHEVERMIPEIGATLRIRRSDLRYYLEVMRTYNEKEHILEPGVHMALFSARASVSAGGFEVITRKDARNLLPTMQMPIDSLETWQMKYLQAMDTIDATACLKRLNKASRAKKGDPKERKFAQQLQKTLEALKDEIDDANFFNSAKLIGKTFKVPCRGPTDKSRPRVATLIAFRLVSAIESRPPGKKLDYTPLALLKTQQLVYKNARDHSILARQTYREFTTTLELSPIQTELSSANPTAPMTPNDVGNIRRTADDYFQTITERLLSHENSERLESALRRRRGNQTPSQVHKTPESSGEGLSGKPASQLGGIMVVRGVSIDRRAIEEIDDEVIVNDADEQRELSKIAFQGVPGSPSSSTAIINTEEEEIEQAEPFVDELFKITIELR